MNTLLIFGSLALIILCTSINCSTDAARKTSASGFNSNCIIGDKSTLALSGTQRQECSFPYSREKVFRIGVQVRSNITGFSIGVFEAAVRRLPHKFPYELIPFNGSSDELVEELARKSFDVGIGDIVIRPSQRVEFSAPYLDPGFMIVVKGKTNEINFSWFLRPFTPALWDMIAYFTIFIGVFIWIMEVKDENFTDTLFSRPWKTNAARIVSILLVVWMVVVIILFVLFARMLILLIIRSQNPPISEFEDFQSLRWTDDAIGCDGQSQTIYYLVKVLGFRRRNIRIVDDDYAKALSNGNIKAVFLLSPYAKVFLAKHCLDYVEEFIEIKPTLNYNLGGFGFVFPKGSPFASDISTIIRELEKSLELYLMEREMLPFPFCRRSRR